MGFDKLALDGSEYQFKNIKAIGQERKAKLDSLLYEIEDLSLFYRTLLLASNKDSLPCCELIL